jgi:hypothetical protein
MIEGTCQRTTDLLVDQRPKLAASVPTKTGGAPANLLVRPVRDIYEAFGAWDDTLADRVDRDVPNRSV